MRPDEVVGPEPYPWPVILKIVITVFLIAPALVSLAFIFFKIVERIRDQIYRQYGRRR
jgi:hypothetical protein